MGTRYSIKLLFLLLFVSVGLKSQITIGAGIPPEKAALLDIKNKDGGAGNATVDYGGLLLPRVELDDVNELTVFLDKTSPDYATQKTRHVGLTIYNIKPDHANNIEKGVYVWNGERWEKSTYRKRVNFFYMPSIQIDTQTSGVKPPINLFQLYKEQFENPKIVSAGAPAGIPYFHNPTDLFYYITDYDSNVLENITISNEGVMTYSVKAQSSPVSFINIVFVVNAQPNGN